MNRTKIIQHYKDFFDLNDFTLGEDDQLMIDWAEALLEDVHITADDSRGFCIVNKEATKELASMVGFAHQKGIKVAIIAAHEIKAKEIDLQAVKEQVMLMDEAMGDLGEAVESLKIQAPKLNDCMIQSQAIMLQELEKQLESRSGWHNPSTIKVQHQHNVKRHNRNIRNQLPQRIRINETQNQTHHTDQK